MSLPALPAKVAVPIPGLGMSLLDTPVSQSFSAEGARFVQIQLGSGQYLWLSPGEYTVPCPAPACVFCEGHDGGHDVIVGRYENDPRELWNKQPDTLCAECAADGQEVRGETSHCHCGLFVYS